MCFNSHVAAAVKVFEKKTTLSAGVEIFLAIDIPLQACFCGTKGTIDEYLYTCVVSVRSTHFNK